MSIPYELIPAIRKRDDLVETAAKREQPPTPFREPARAETREVHDLAVSNAELAEALACFQHAFEPE
jgi:hypothetical protein